MIPRKIGIGKTPRYVLLHTLVRASPVMATDWTQTGTSIIYGFSDASPYREFQSHSETKLTPYPLVRQYLEDQLKGDESHLHLIVLDATGPNDPVIGAVTTTDVLASFRDNAATIPVRYLFEWDAIRQAYLPSDSAA